MGSDPRMPSLGKTPRDPVSNWTQGKYRGILEVSASRVSSSLGSFLLFPLPQPSTIGLCTTHCSEALSLFLTCSSYLFAYFISTANFNSNITYCSLNSVSLVAFMFICAIPQHCVPLEHLCQFVVIHLFL